MHITCETLQKLSPYVGLASLIAKLTPNPVDNALVAVLQQLLADANTCKMFAAVLDELAHKLGLHDPDAPQAAYSLAMLKKAVSRCNCDNPDCECD